MPKIEHKCLYGIVFPNKTAEDQAAPWQIMTIASLFVGKDSAGDDYEEG